MDYTSGASRMGAGQGICVLRQGILGHFRPLLDIFGAKGLFKDTFLFEGRGCISLFPPRCAPAMGILQAPGHLHGQYVECISFTVLD